MQLDARALADATADIVRRHVEAATAPLLRRIEELEARPAPERGEKGDAGERGADGRDGVGLAGALIDRGGSLILTLTDGTTRDLGSVVGKDGEVGPKGEKGDPGADGIDGRDGVDGKDGAPGADGRDGADGQDAYPGEAKGLYDPEAEYRAMDVVSFNGSEWRAKRDNPGELPGDGWMLSAQRGKRGDRGERGEKGAEGRPGQNGAQLIGIGLDADEMQFLGILDNGEQIEADFTPIAQKIVEAVRNA